MVSSTPGILIKNNSTCASKHASFHWKGRVWTIRRCLLSQTEHRRQVLSSLHCCGKIHLNVTSISTSEAHLLRLNIINPDKLIWSCIERLSDSLQKTIVICTVAIKTEWNLKYTHEHKRIHMLRKSPWQRASVYIQDFWNLATFLVTSYALTLQS